MRELLVTFEILRTQRVQDIVSIWCVAALKLCVHVGSTVKIWSRTQSYRNYHLTLVCLSHLFGTILVPFLTIFARFKYYFILIYRQ